MNKWGFGARALAGAAALAMAGAALAQQQAPAAAPAAEPAPQGPIPRATAYAELAKLPNFSGIWTTDRRALGNAGPPARIQFTAAGQAMSDAFRAKQAAEGVNQEAQQHCYPPGIPGVMNQPYPIELSFQPGMVLIFAEAYAQQRRIYTDGRPLPEDPDLFFNGNSVGHWEGDTLIVDTVGFSPLTNLTAGIPHTEKSKVRERIWLQGPDTLRIETTITEPDLLAAPYVTQAAFARRPDYVIREYVCAENNRLVGGEGGANIDLGLDEEEDPFAGLDDE